VTDSCEFALAFFHYHAVRHRGLAPLSHPVGKLRLGPQTSIPNLILAGDWTDTGLPAMIESAVMSGNVAAKILADFEVSR